MILRNICLHIAYDGTDFHGWQKQSGVRTVQEELEQAVRRVCRHQVDLIGSGRTDAGVHAVGQAANFLTDRNLPPDRFHHALGVRLPKDLSITALQEVHPAFNARSSALSKLYRYRVYHAKHRPVEHFAQRYTYHVWHRLELCPMREASRHFVGEQDFAAVAAKSMDRPSTVRTVLRCDVERHFDEIRFEVEGKGFLYNQVRNMVGTLLQVGLGRFKPDDVKTILQSKDRSNAGPTAPARGLCLQWVRYPGHLLTPATDEGPVQTSDQIPWPGATDQPANCTP